MGMLQTSMSYSSDDAVQELSWFRRRQKKSGQQRKESNRIWCKALSLHTHCLLLISW